MCGTFFWRRQRGLGSRWRRRSTAQRSSERVCAALRGYSESRAIYWPCKHCSFRCLIIPHVPCEVALLTVPVLSSVPWRKIPKPNLLLPTCHQRPTRTLVSRPRCEMRAALPPKLFGSPASFYIHSVVALFLLTPAYACSLTLLWYYGAVRPAEKNTLEKEISLRENCLARRAPERIVGRGKRDRGMTQMCLR